MRTSVPSASGKSFQLRAKDGDWYPLQIDEPNETDIDFWHNYVSPKLAGDEGRWRWPLFFKLHNSKVRGKSFMAVIRLNQSGLPSVPLGLVWAFGPFISPDPGGTYQSKPYLGYLCRLPQELLAPFGLDVNLPVGGELIEAVHRFAQQISSNPSDKLASFFLHASPKGSKQEQERLYDYYAVRGLVQIPENLRLGKRPTHVFFYLHNDGRYFHFSDHAIPALRSKVATRWP